MAFLDVPRYPCDALDGAGVPLRLASLSAMAALYGADAHVLRTLLPPAMAGALQPLSWRPGRGLLGLIAVRYAEGDLGAYDELAVVIPVGRGAMPRLQALGNLFRQRFEAFIWHMPVTTPRARDGGVRLAGFPKRVADLRCDADAAWRRCALHEGGAAPSLTLACRADAGHGPARELSLLSHTLLDGVPQVSELRLRQERWAEHLGGDGAVLTLGDGALADALRPLRISARPLWSQLVPQAQALLYPPRLLGAD